MIVARGIRVLLMSVRDRCYTQVYKRSLSLGDNNVEDLPDRLM